MTSQRIFQKPCISIFFAIFMLLVPGGKLISQQSGKGKLTREFEGKVAFYLDQKVQTFLHEMIDREKLLLGMIDNIRDEVAVRDAARLGNTGIPFAALNEESNNLVAAYQQELNRLTTIVAYIERLENVALQRNKVHLLLPLHNLEKKIAQILTDNRFVQDGRWTSNELMALISEYDREVKALVTLYDRLVSYQDSDVNVRSDQLQVELDEQRVNIIAVLDEFAIAPQDSAGKQYALEIRQVEKILREIRSLKPVARKYDQLVERQLSRLHTELLAGLDKRVAAMIELDGWAPDSYPIAMRMFREWRAKELAEYQVSFTRHRIMKESLLRHGNREERQRMLRRDLTDALDSYDAAGYRLAEQRFTRMLKDYSDDFNLAAIRFYRGEARYALGHLISARRDFEAVANEELASGHKLKSLLRLMQIADQSGQHDTVAETYRQLIALQMPANEFDLDDAHYLAGYAYVAGKQFGLAEEALRKVSTGSEYHLRARYLIAVAEAGQKRFTSAVSILQSLVQSNAENKPGIWKSLINDCMLKLGYIHYELGDYRRSLTYFEQADSPSTQSQSKIGAGWAYLQLGELEKVLTSSQEIFQQAVDATYAYEAMVLSARASRLKADNSAALNSFLYVADAQVVFDISNQLNEERRALAKQENTFVNLEELALERDDLDAYADIQRNLKRLGNTLETLRYRGEISTPLLEDFDLERELVLTQVAELDQMIIDAHSLGFTDFVNRADEQRERLVRALDSYQSDLAVRYKHFFGDYPVTSREMAETYRSRFLAEVRARTDNECEKLQAILQKIEQLKQSSAYLSRGDVQLALELIAADINRLEGDSERFITWLGSNGVEVSDSQFSHWANLAGVGISDITLEQMYQADEQIAQLAYNSSFVDQLIRKRYNVLEHRMQQYDTLIRSLEHKLQLKDYQQYQQDRDKYFEEDYFNLQEKEDASDSSSADSEDSKAYKN